MVSPETAGVPHGGQYGNVDRFREDAARHGFKVGWSMVHNCFGIYTEDRPGDPTFQILWRNRRTGDALPLTRDFLWLLCYLRREHAKTSARTFQQYLDDLKSEAKRRRAKEKYDQINDMSLDVGTEALIQNGKMTRKMISVPQMMGVNNG